MCQVALVHAPLEAEQRESRRLRFHSALARRRVNVRWALNGRMT
ncbi:hypothetical protein SCNRRL3882_0222 [Streptomyces chartreusis NRRL 3882]|uniref:Uncharacterized protein n=1 Tax=Streptomyces chartreusis NRRL 3882 TaxID=1079985 RepID=A0A2N9B086_STRCX|nr:hypothetical protein SCNRRL3882_0222 [Streptomyces chartreusis NRRL 3882]